jgi:ribosomal protein S18 acetylase RimI-like enzyme
MEGIVTMSEFINRRATSVDIPALTALRWDMCYEQGVAKAADRPAYESALTTFLAEHLDHDECQIWVVEAADGIIANAMMWLYPMLPRPGVPHDWHGYVTNVYTRPAYRRRGLARRLMEALADAARQHGATQLSLETTPEAQHLYFRLGYQSSEALQLSLA